MIAALSHSASERKKTFPPLPHGLRPLATSGLLFGASLRIMARDHDCSGPPKKNLDAKYAEEKPRYQPSGTPIIKCRENPHEFPLLSLRALG